MIFSYKTVFLSIFELNNQMHLLINKKKINKWLQQLNVHLFQNKIRERESLNLTGKKAPG